MLIREEEEEERRRGGGYDDLEAVEVELLALGDAGEGDREGCIMSSHLLQGAGKRQLNHGIL